jgi:hypothetical protein
MVQLSAPATLLGGCMNLKLSQSGLKFAVQRGSAAKAVYTLERFCPPLSMAPVLAIVSMVAVLS